MLRFAVVGIDHGHTFDHVKGLLAAGGEFVGYCPQTSVPALREAFEKTYPDAPQIDRESCSTIRRSMSSAFPRFRVIVPGLLSAQ